MGEVVQVRRKGPVAIVTLDNPPVNALSNAVRQALLDAVTQIAADPSVKAMVLACAGTTFCVGADVRELGAQSMKPSSAEVMGAIDALGVLTVAAIQGQALGGGLELALLCDFRVSTPTARFGMPEIKLGLIPGAAGTQRLPRLIGAEAAMAMIVSGDPIDAKKAVANGLVDETAEGDLVAAAVALANRKLTEGAVGRRLSRQPPVTTDLDFAAARAKAIKDAKGLQAAGSAVDAVAASRLPFADGVKEERRLFEELRNSTESAALRHLFAADRVVGTIPGVDKAAPTRPIERVAIIGAGTMGSGIAMAMLNAGLWVELIELNPDALARGLKTIGSTYDSQVERGRMTAAERDGRMGRLVSGGDLKLAANADLVIEAIFEDMDAKKALFADLGRICKPGAILATNTSALDVNEIAEAGGRPEDSVGLHFFSPANIMKLVEVVRAAKTSTEVLATALALCKRIGKIGVVSGVCDGFIGNRMLGGYRREAELLVLEGASPQQVDRALTGFGMAMGLNAVADLAGLDVAAASRERRRKEGKLGDDPRLGAVPDRLVALGRLGIKTGAGFYKYAEGSRAPEPDPLVDAIIAEEAARLGVVQRQISDEEIVSRCILPLVNEGAKILEEGIALGAADIDVVWTNGYGFPRRLGGPMFYADTLGLDRVVETMAGYAATLPKCEAYWTPAPLLARLAAEGGKFSDLPRGTKS